MTSVPVLTEAKAISLYGQSHVEIPVASTKPKATSGASTYVESTSSFRSHYRNLPAVADYDEYDVALSAGTWTLVVEGWVGASLGRVAVSLDGVQVGVIDTYSSGSTLASRFTFPGISVLTGGTHTIRFTVAAKNASSAGTAIRIAHVAFTREGPSAVPDAFDWTYVTADFIPRSIGTDGLVYGENPTGNGRVLRRSSDGGVTFEDGYDFGNAPGLIGGEYIVFATRTTAGYVVITSTDVSLPGNSGHIYFSTSFTTGFTSVQVIKGTNEFSVSKPETGPNDHTWLAVGEYSTDAPQPVHYLWHTSDGGQTWRNIKTATVVNAAQNSHFHGCVHDPSDGMRLWSSQGDTDNAVFAYTDDAEAATPTWNVVTLGTHPQPTTVGVFPGRLFMSPDHLGVAGVWTGLTTAPTLMAEAFETPSAEIATQHFGRSPYAQDTSRAVLCIPDKSSATLKSYFVGSGDYGKTWHLLHTMDLTTSGGGSYGVIGPDASGRIFHRSISNPAPASSFLMVAQMPTFRQVP